MKNHKGIIIFLIVLAIVLTVGLTYGKKHGWHEKIKDVFKKKKDGAQHLDGRHQSIHGRRRQTGYNFTEGDYIGKDGQTYNNQGQLIDEGDNVILDDDGNPYIDPDFLSPLPEMDDSLPTDDGSGSGGGGSGGGSDTGNPSNPATLPFTPIILGKNPFSRFTAPPTRKNNTLANRGTKMTGGSGLPKLPPLPTFRVGTTVTRTNRAGKGTRLA